MEFPLSLRFKLFDFAPQLYVHDASGTSILYVRQKALRIKEEVAVFTDDSKATQLFAIRADNFLDFSGRYHFSFTDDGTPLGSIRRHGMRSLWRTHYEIEPPEHESDAPVLTIGEENPWSKVGDSLFGGLPIIGALSGYVFHPRYSLTTPDGTAQLRLSKRPAFFEGLFTIERLVPAIEEMAQWRMLLGLLMMVLLEKNRG